MHHSNENGRPALRKLRRGKQSGFIQTLELLIILAVFGTVFYFVLEMAHNWLIAQIDPLGGKHVVVYDSSGSLITRTNSFVGHEAPVRVYRVSTLEAAILGTRGEADGGFTTHQRLYFTNSYDCGTTMVDPNYAMLEWIIDPSMAAAAKVQFLQWDTSTPFPPSYAAALPPLTTLGAGVAYGHPVSDFYTLQTVAFAIGPDLGMGTLRRAYGTLSTDPPSVVDFDGAQYGYPTSEWDSERYDLDRCRRIGSFTTVQAAASEEQRALGEHLMMVDGNYSVVDKDGIPYAPMFWTPAAINPTPPVPNALGTPLNVNAPATESGPPGGAPATFTDAQGVVHKLPGDESTPP